MDYRARTVAGSRIFISYRRGTSSAHAGRLADRLSAEFGGDYVFMDVDTIEPGADFVDHIEDAVGNCDVLIALIGDEWLECRDDQGHRRLDDPEDFVRLEVGAGLERDIRVVPVLVEGAAMPRADELPEPLRRLARRNALEVTDTRWRHDVGRLIEAVHKVLEGTRPAQAIQEVEAGPVAHAPPPHAAQTPVAHTPPAAEQPPAQDGVQPPAANLLSYLSFGIGGVVMLLTNKDREIRFHAVQSIVLAVVDLVLIVGLAIIFGILESIVYASPLSGSYMLSLQIEEIGTQVIALVLLVLLVLQGYLCVQGYRERHVKLLVIGEHAERWAGAGGR